MAQKVVVSRMSLTEDYQSISAPNNCGQIIIDINEQEYYATKIYKDNLGGVVFGLYITFDNNGTEEYIPIKDRAFVWSEGKDISKTIEDIPEDCVLKIQPILNKDLKDLKDEKGNPLYPDVISDIPISIIWDDSPIMSGGGSGGGSGASVIVGDESEVQTELDNAPIGALWIDTEDDTVDIPNGDNLTY